MTANASSAAAPVAETHAIVITREFDAPRELVFAMWTEREHFVHWMRPSGFATVDCELMDARPGGNVRTRMRLADGAEFVSEWTFREIVRPSRIVYDETCTENGHVFHRAQQTVTFDERGGKTTLTLSAVLELVPGRDPKWTLQMMDQGWNAGWAVNLDQLAAELRRSAGRG
jgi:uncharacterized protein YndB with AHSA1/START domain